ncbi:response regulator [Alicyclobacillus tolerans]|uniref:Two-component system alkaline phosphatase synthesis response regulator PhoP n=2 Tax=Alicyclobacillus tolerans TaxID=90970 RepID=A0ABT9LWI2_9BACL|nr:MULTISPECIES: response regulator transcription factor [Alicyclobacillus]MDP9728630.1 two-component system alkaline phosphatase synthesis response regulator PhoP [Alicyclobacillus tengchongensis]QRF22623.1 response regulator transcription factor [Alicyclobacillus sp. TC]SHJ77701.1 two-component system, OmpR family, alkaline phosphatase synthesis response regulator PhoP [Alicyclobacillus montanus]
MPTVLVVDDEESIRTLVAYNFQKSGYEVETVGDGKSAYELIRQNPQRLSLVILDLMLPGMDGLEVCRRLRQEKVEVPIILLTARDEEVDLVVGLEMGADDYVKKPFSPRELVARARAVLRRMDNTEEDIEEASSSRTLKAGDVLVDLSKHEVSLAGALIDLTPKEFDLLQYFLENKEHVLSRDQLLDRVWGYNSTTDTRIVDVHVSHLRDKIEKDPKNPLYIRTVRGVGYKFTDPSGRSSG